LLPLAVFCAAVSVVLYLFAGYHMWLVFRNTTTNETFKRSDYQQYVEFFLKKKKEIELKKEQGETKDLEELPPEPKHDLNKKGKVVIKNIYDKGLFRNYWEIISPPSFRTKQFPKESIPTQQQNNKNHNSKKKPQSKKKTK